MQFRAALKPKPHDCRVFYSCGTAPGAPIQQDRGTTRKKMFGGTAHILNGNLLCGVHKNCLILRLGEQAAAPWRTGRHRGAEASARHAV